jgi:hypothetical protein
MNKPDLSNLSKFEIDFLKEVETFCARYKDQPDKRCVHAAAELFVHLGDLMYAVAAISGVVEVAMGIVRIPKRFEHAWIEAEIAGEVWVLDPTGPQQFYGPLIAKKTDWQGTLKSPLKERMPKEDEE